MNSCNYCDSPDPQYQCGDCQAAQYCGVECQSKHWAELHQAEHVGKRQWIQKSHMKEGRFTRKAKSRGLTPAEFQRRVLANPEQYDTRTVREANLRKTLVGM